jgi:hypothetical protein
MAAINKKGCGRGERIRTSDLSVPNRAHYQAVLRPENRNQCFDRPSLKGAILAGALRRGQDSLMQRYQEIARHCQGPTPMANLVFNLQVQLGEC